MKNQLKSDGFVQLKKYPIQGILQGTTLQRCALPDLLAGLVNYNFFFSSHIARNDG
jgi:hypothetical protein